MTAWVIANIAPMMFVALIITLLVGFPVAFSLGFVGIACRLLVDISIVNAPHDDVSL